MALKSWQDQIEDAIAEQEESADTIKIETVQSQDESRESVTIRILLGMAIALVFFVLVGVVGYGMWVEVQALKGMVP